MKTSPTCAEACPIRVFCTGQQEIYDRVRSRIYGDEDHPGVISMSMEADEKHRQLGLDKIPEVADPAQQARDSLVPLLDSIEDMKPPAFDFEAMATDCDGPQENKEGLSYGFNATRRCGSLAIDEETRRGYTQIIQKAQPEQ